MKDSWERKIGGVTVVYSREGVVGGGFNHNCNLKRGDVTIRVTTIQSTEQLAREEVERRFALDPMYRYYISE